MNDLRTAAQQLLGACEQRLPLKGQAEIIDELNNLRAALVEPVQEPQCNPHPKAPHGFLRNASHTEGRYVCECEEWEPYEAGYQAGMEAALRAQS